MSPWNSALLICDNVTEIIICSDYLLDDVGKNNDRQYERRAWVLQRHGKDRLEPAGEKHDGHLGNISRGAIGPMLDAVGITPGARLLEVACGTGYGSGMAAEKGVEAIGIDFAPTMVEEARRRFPGAEFREGDAEALEFEDVSFDAVICPLGILHFPNPQMAISEAFRVLKPGGRYAFTVWCTPDKAKWLGIVRDAIEAHGDTGVQLPPAPPFFHFSDHDTSKNALAEAGFADADITVLPLTLTIEAPEAFLDLVYKSTVRSAAALELQSESARAKIHQAIIAEVRRFETAKGFVIPASVVLATASKP